jgi:hypothetical protein
MWKATIDFPEIFRELAEAPTIGRHAGILA